MFSVTYTGMNFFPLCTATVCPTNSGRMVDRRDQVRTTFFSLVAASTASLASRGVSVNGPFFTLLPIPLPLLALAVDDPLVGALVVARLETASGLAPRRHRVPAARRLALATAVRVIHRVHRYAAVVGRLPQPALASRLAQRNVFVVHVAHLAHRRHALHRHAPDLGRWQLQQRHPAFARYQLSLRTRRARHLAALAGLQFDIVNHRAGRDVLQRKRVANQDVGRRAAHDLHAHLQPVGLQDVAPLPVRVIQQRDTRRAVGIVFDGRDHGRNAALVALEIYHPVRLLGAAADEPRSHAARAVAAAGALLGFHQRLLGTILGDVLAGNYRLEAPGWGRGSISLDRHGRFPLNLRKVGDFLPRLKLHVGLLPVRTVSGEAAAPPQLTVERRGAHFVHLDLEQLLHRGLDLRLIGFRVYLEAQRTLVIFFGDALLGHERALNHFIEVHFASASENLRAAASLISTLL